MSGKWRIRKSGGNYWIAWWDQPSPRLFAPTGHSFQSWADAVGYVVDRVDSAQIPPATEAW